MKPKLPLKEGVSLAHTNKEPTENQPIKNVLERINTRLARIDAHTKQLGDHELILRKLDDNTNRILRAIRNEGTKVVDARSPAERRLIDRAVELYVYRHDVQGLDVAESTCYRSVWHKHKGEKVFRDYRQFENAARYDLNHYYDLSVLTMRIRTHPPE